MPCRQAYVIIQSSCYFYKLGFLRSIVTPRNMRGNLLDFFRESSSENFGKVPGKRTQGVCFSVPLKACSKFVKLIEHRAIFKN